MPDYLDDLSLFLENTTFDDLPEAVLERARFVIADCVAAVIGGAAEPEMQRLVARMAGNGGGSSTVLGAGLRVDASKAAFLNGTAGTFLEMDEGNQFNRGHPGIHVVPAALALAEAMGRNGRDVLLAVTLGYEVGARIGMAAKIRPSMHPHGTWGTTGAAVAVAKMMRADAVQFREVINISSSLGLTTSRQTMLQGGTVRNSFSGFSGQSKGKSLLNIQALENCKMLFFEEDKFTALRYKYRDLLILGSKISEKELMLKSKKEVLLATGNLKSLYLFFQNNFPGLENRIAQRYVASYIGADPVSLSRVRSELLKESSIKSTTIAKNP
ncbi:MAG: MmgE/PrpD family protein [Pseudomonadales bacterium]